MARSGLKKVTKSVRGKHGTVRRAYYVKAASPQVHGASRGRRLAGVLVGGAIGAGVGALFGSAGGAAAGAHHASKAIEGQAMWRAGINAASGNIHPSVRRSVVADFVRNNPQTAGAHVAKVTAGSAAIFGAGGAATGGAFGAALGYAIANRSGRGGHAIRNSR